MASSAIWIPFRQPLCPLNWKFPDSSNCPHCLWTSLVPSTILGPWDTLNKCPENRQYRKHINTRAPRNSSCLWLFCGSDWILFCSPLRCLLNLCLQIQLLKIWLIWAQNGISKSPLPKHIAHQQCLPLFIALLHWNMMMPGRQRCVFSGIQFSWSLAPSISLFTKGWCKHQFVSYG